MPVEHKVGSDGECTVPGVRKPGSDSRAAMLNTPSLRASFSSFTDVVRETLFEDLN